MLYAGASVPVPADAASECAKVAGGAHRSCSTSARSLLENGMYGFGRLYSAKTMSACVIYQSQACHAAQSGAFRDRAHSWYSQYSQWALGLEREGS